MSFVHEVTGTEPIAAAAGSDTRPDPTDIASRRQATTGDRAIAVVRYFRRNRSLVVGTVMIVGLLLFSLIGSLVWDIDRYRPLSVRALQAAVVGPAVRQRPPGP